MRYAILLAMLLLSLPVRGEAWQVVGGGAAMSSKLSVAEDFNSYSSYQYLSGRNGWVIPVPPGLIYDGPKVYSGKLIGVPSRIGLAYWGADTFAEDQRACLQVIATGIGGGPAVRIQPEETTTGVSYNIYATTGNLYTLRKSENTLATYQAQSVGDVVCLGATGGPSTTLTVTINGVAQASYVDSSSPIRGGQPGVFNRNNIFEADNWTAEEL